MIFRTGSVLIVGKCSESIIDVIYNFVRNMLEEEYENVGDALIEPSAQTQETPNKRKARKRKIIVTRQPAIMCPQATSSHSVMV